MCRKVGSVTHVQHWISRSHSLGTEFLVPSSLVAAGGRIVRTSVRWGLAYWTPKNVNPLQNEAPRVAVGHGMHGGFIRLHLARCVGTTLLGSLSPECVLCQLSMSRSAVSHRGSGKLERRREQERCVQPPRRTQAAFAFLADVPVAKHLSAYRARSKGRDALDVEGT